MCNNIPNAAPETHATLIATLVLNSGSIVIASPTASPSTALSTTAFVMTPTPTPTPTTTPTPTSSMSSTSITPAAATTSTAAPAASSSSSTSGLTRAQIGGIAGGIAGIGVLALLLALFLLLRRRKQRNSPDFARMRDSSWPSTLITKGSPGGSLPISQPHYQEPKVMSFTRALAKRVSSKPGRRSGPNFGLAISPGSDGGGGGRKLGTGVGLDHVVHSPVGAPPFVIRNVPPSPERRRSPLPLPPPPPAAATVPPMSPGRALSSFKFYPQDAQARAQPQQQQRPTLALAIPQRASTHDGGRDSIITEFAEDGEDAQIWRPPQSADPGSAAAAMYYVADKWGNWVLREKNNPQYFGATSVTAEAAELATPISKTKEEKAREEEDMEVAESAAVRELRHYSSPTIPQSLVGSGVEGTGKRASTAGKPTIRLVTPDTGRLPVNSRGGSSVYSNHPSYSPYAVPGPDNPMPRYMPPYTANGSGMKRNSGSGGGGRGSQRRSRNDARRLPPERQFSRDSATTIMSQDSVATTIADSSPVEDMINAVLDDLAFPVSSRQPPQYSMPPPQQGNNNNNSNNKLSPVVESPAAGRNSPVRYPQIPRAQSTTSNNKYKALGPNKRPLPNPLLARIAGQEQRPLKDSPTLGLIDPVQNRPGSNPSDNPHLRPAGSSAMNTTTQQQQQQQHLKASDRALLPSQRLSVYDAYNDPSTHPQQRRQQQQQQQQQAPAAYPSPQSPPRSQGPQHRASPSPPPQRPKLVPGQAYGQPAFDQRTRSPLEAYTPSPPSTSSAEEYPRRAYYQPPQGVVVRSVDDGRARDAHSTTLLGWRPQLTPRRQGDELYLSVQ
ncbi:unnamed protein product [Discula destructiva]